MGKFSGILICADFDNTIAISAEVVKKNTEAIRYFQQNGGMFSIISGRTARFLRLKANDAPCNTYVGCVNGTVICDLENDTIVFENFIENDASQGLIEVCKKYPDVIHEMIIFRKDKNITLQTKDADFEEQLREAFDGNVHKFLFHGASDFLPEHLSEIRSILGDRYEISRSWGRGVEGQNKGVNKAKAARMIAELSGAKLLVCVGDYENDIPMIEEADIGYAVGNAIDSLKAVADRLTVSVEDGAIAAVVSDLESQIK